jgi:hypothetical protein
LFGKKKSKKMVSRVLENKKVKAILIAAGILLGIYLAIGSAINRIYVNKLTVENAWLALKQNCDYRLELLADWVNFLKHYAPSATGVLEDLNQAYMSAKKNQYTYKILTEKEKLQAFVNSQQDISLSLQKMYNILSEHPELLQNTDFVALNNETETVELQIVYTARALNDTVLLYNASITGTPGGWVNLFLHYSPLYTFTFPAVVITPKTSPRPR